MPTDQAGIVADEEARNGRYLEWLTEKARTVVPIAVAASARWTRDSLPRLEQPVVHPVIGRVGLDDAFDAIGSDNFYIGPWRRDDGDLQVVSWAAPIASAYFGTADYPELDGRVQVTRAFEHERERIVDFDDERHGGGAGPTAFDRRTPLRVKRPPRPAAPPAAAAARQADPPIVIPAQAPPPSPTPAPPPPVRPAARGGVSADLRHADALRRALAAPRRAALKQVLSTLQPEQYQLVSWPADLPLIVQGHPGSGKTVVAVHRAGFLKNPERAGGAVAGRVLLVGPTSNYVRHTRQALNSLTADNEVQVSSIHDVLRMLLDDLPAVAHPGQEDYRDYDVELAKLVDRVAHALRTRNNLPTQLDVALRAQRVYETLRLSGPSATGDWPEYLAGLPEWKIARRKERYVPLLAYCALAARGTPPAGFEHILADEAQDVRPIEWLILGRLNAGGQWTIVGDMNQRRSDCCYTSWDQLARAVGLEGEDGRAVVQHHRNVYRSTGAILAFAAQLLPNRDRDGHAVQQVGERPTVERVKENDLELALARHARELCQRHPGGTVALIGIDTAPLRRALVKENWQAISAGADTYRRDSMSCRLLTPYDARGLEFDAVVVVEPADFPKNVGRQGVLYTSLTRGNKELVVLHTKPLPDELRSAARFASQSGRTRSSRPVAAAPVAVGSGITSQTAPDIGV
jgi:DNA helicase-2/ATP-dependent DNA helicase PcrA